MLKNKDDLIEKLVVRIIDSWSERDLEEYACYKLTEFYDHEEEEDLIEELDNYDISFEVEK